jgi:phosphate transport system permease protein
MKTAKIKEEAIRLFLFSCSIAVVVMLIGIFALLFVKTVPAFRDISMKEFFLTADWDPTGYERSRYGILAMIKSSLMVTFGAMAIAVPLGIGTASFLNEIAGARLREILKPVIEILAGVPSVVVGFLGIVLFGPLIAKLFGLNSGLNALNGSLLLAIMALPTIISISEDALNSVPNSYCEGSYALGANRWQTLVRVKIPSALSGIIAACMLGMGRAIGETMTVLMATGCATALPHSFLDPVRTMTAAIAIELGEVAFNSTHYYALFAVGFVLFLMTFAVNMVSDIILHKHQALQR